MNGEIIMTNSNTISVRDKQVRLRNGMVMVLQEGIRRTSNNNEHKDYTFISETFQKIKNIEGFKVDKLEDKDKSVYIDGVLYTDRHAIYEVTENENPIFYIYKDRTDLCYGLEVINAEDLMYDDELVKQDELKSYIENTLSEIQRENKKKTRKRTKSHIPVS